MTAARLLVRGVAVALVVLAAGCGTKPAPPSARVEVGGLSVLGAGAGSAFVAPVPDAQDGVAGRNPPGTVEVYSTGAFPVLTLDLSPTNLCGGSAVHADVIVRNYATEQLGNVVVQFTSMSPVANTICNAPPTPGLSGVTSSIGLIGHGDLAGSAVPDGSAPGGSSTVGWWIHYGSGTFSFAAKVWADVTPAPPTNGTPAAGAFVAYPGTEPVLAWSGATPEGRVQIATDPSFAATTLFANVVLTGTGSAPPYAFSYQAPSGDGGRRYWWRAVNRFVQPGGTVTVDGTFSTGGSYVVDKPPTGLQSPATELTWAEMVLTATSGAPYVDFYTWNWQETWGGYVYPPHTQASPYYQAPNTRPASPPDLTWPPTWTIHAGTPCPNLSVDHLVGWKACTRYVPAAGNWTGADYLLHDGACTDGTPILVTDATVQCP